MTKNIVQKIALLRRVQDCLTGAATVGLVLDAEGWHLRAFGQGDYFVNTNCLVHEDPEHLVDEAIKSHYKKVIELVAVRVREGIGAAGREVLESLARELEAEVVG